MLAWLAVCLSEMIVNEILRCRFRRLALICCSPIRALLGKAVGTCRLGRQAEIARPTARFSIRDMWWRKSCLQIREQYTVNDMSLYSLKIFRKEHHSVSVPNQSPSLYDRQT